MTDTKPSPAPWAYQYSPYTVRLANDCSDAAGTELPAYEVFDADCNKVFDTNEDMHGDIQEANARLATAAPALLAALEQCAALFADYDDDPGEEGEAYREAMAAISEATSGCLALTESSGGKPYSVLLLYPDYANHSGTETFYALIHATDPIEAVVLARRQAVAAQGVEIDPDDFAPLLVTQGHHASESLFNK